MAIEDAVTDSAIKLAKNFSRIYSTSGSAGSLIEFSKPTRAEPIVLMDDRVAGLSFANQLMQSMSSIFCGYYLQAVALSVNVGKIDVVRLLDSVNPNRDPQAQLARSLSGYFNSMVSSESYQYALPYPGQPVGLEHYGVENPSMEDDSAIAVGDSIKNIKEANDLSVGKMLEVEIESNGSKAKFPIAVRMIVSTAPSSSVIHTLSLGQERRSYKERWHGYRSGELSLVRDMILCQDLIDAHRDGLIKDPSGIYADNIQRRRQNRISAILSGQPSIATASNIVVIADETRKELERNIRGRLEDFRTREKVFKATYTMLLAVVDPEWEHITIYHRSIPRPTELSAGDLKSASGSKGPDVAEILKAYAAGSAPSI